MIDEKNNKYKINKHSNQACKIGHKCFRKLETQSHRFVISGSGKQDTGQLYYPYSKMIQLTNLGTESA